MFVVLCVILGISLSSVITFDKIPKKIEKKLEEKVDQFLSYQNK